MPIDRALVDGLIAGGVAREAITFDWIGQRRGLPALTEYDENKRQAVRLSKRLANAYHADPRRRMTLTAHSGGTAVAVWALEDLPADVKIDYLVLIASALSPDYDLSTALAHVRCRAIAFNSPHDNIVLGNGTQVFGTMDRVYGPAAGYVGFRPPPESKSNAYDQLLQLSYDPAWQAQGNYGDHIGVMTRPFAESMLAPMLDPLNPSTQPTGYRLK